jgi:hypothetical protein
VRARPCRRPVPQIENRIETNRRHDAKSSGRGVMSAGAHGMRTKSTVNYMTQCGRGPLIMQTV